ncbi:MAG: S-methyl-5-thioribose-1-phosphate isomerase [Lachnospiraceae bacterium]|jgi:methylthioribose-1-phosphate isomerase
MSKNDVQKIAENKKSIMDYDTVALNEEKDALVIIDQTKLPYSIEILELTEIKDIRDAIYLLQVRGAPAIGVAAAIGIYLEAKKLAKKYTEFETFYPEFVKTKDYLDSARPTAVNLSWALNRMDKVVQSNKEKSVPEIIQALHDEAVAVREEDIRVCKMIGEYGLSLVKPGDGLLTHCNAGKLATVKYGTATAPMYLGQERGYNFRIFSDETRPLLQGARLTSFELFDSGLDVTVICDNMSGTVMKNGWVNAVFVGCDRIAANGDTANKIGTSMVAALAKRNNIPFYVCAPTSTIDMNTPAGDEIRIEERSPEEVTEMWYKERMAPKGVKVFNPAFDITDNDLITAIITEYGIARAPFKESFEEIFRKKEAAKAKG